MIPNWGLGTYYPTFSQLQKWNDCVCKTYSTCTVLALFRLCQKQECHQIIGVFARNSLTWSLFFWHILIIQFSVHFFGNICQFFFELVCISKSKYSISTQNARYKKIQQHSVNMCFMTVPIRGSWSKTVFI